MSGAKDRARVAELIVTCAQGRRRGSGYRVTRDAVLTAAHVVDDAVSVEVRFEPDLPGQWVCAAVSWWADARSDVALLLIPPCHWRCSARRSTSSPDNRWSRASGVPHPEMGRAAARKLIGLLGVNRSAPGQEVLSCEAVAGETAGPPC